MISEGVPEHIAEYWDGVYRSLAEKSARKRRAAWCAWARRQPRFIRSMGFLLGRSIRPEEIKPTHVKLLMGCRYHFGGSSREH